MRVRRHPLAAVETREKTRCIWRWSCAERQAGGSVPACGPLCLHSGAARAGLSRFSRRFTALGTFRDLGMVATDERGDEGTLGVGGVPSAGASDLADVRAAVPAPVEHLRRTNVAFPTSRLSKEVSSLTRHYLLYNCLQICLQSCLQSRLQSYLQILCADSIWMRVSPTLSLL